MIFIFIFYVGWMRGELVYDHSFPLSNRCEKALLGISESDLIFLCWMDER